MVGVGIIGMGSISGQHIEAYKTFQKRCRIYGVYDRKKEKAVEKSQVYGLQADIYTDYRELLKDSRIQLVSICLPPFLHKTVAIDCMKEGKDVLVEKPMAPSLEECDEMLQVQKKTGRYLGVVSQNRYLKDYVFLKKMIQTGRLGVLLSGSAKSCWYRGEAYYKPEWRGTWEFEGGGCVLNHAVHQIDLLNWMLGKPRTVLAMTANVNHRKSQVEDLAAAILQYDRGMMVTLQTSLIAQQEEQGILLEGMEAAVSAPISFSCKIQMENGFPRNDVKKKEEFEQEYTKLKGPFQTPFFGQINDVLESVETGEEKGVTGYDGRDSIEVITAIYASARGKMPVELPIGSSSYFYKKETRMKQLKGEEKEK